MAPLKPPSIFKHKALFGFQLPIFPFKLFPLNFFLKFENICFKRVFDLENYEF
jgi:hypothetical protein